jgi:hypothetical protein
MPRIRTDQEKHPERYFTNSVGHIRDRIIFHASQDIPKEGRFFSLNGFSFLAKPGVEVDIPRPVRLMLDTRITTETIKGDDDQIYTRDIPRVTYTLVKEGCNLPDGMVIVTDAARDSEKGEEA